MTKTHLLLFAGAAGFALGGCSSVSQTLGMEKSTPDEFRVVTKAPLSVPPEYSLRPPAPGQALPAEIAAAQSDRVISFGQDLGADASASERLLVRSAGAIAVNPVIRAQVDYEEADIIRKQQSFADRVLFWRGTEEEVAEAAGDSATGGVEVTIQPTGQPAVKLPGT